MRYKNMDTSKLAKTISELDGSVKRFMVNLLSKGNEKAELVAELVDSTSDGYWDWHVGTGKDGGEDYEYLSPKLKKQLGYKDHELPNAPSSWMNICHKEDLEKAHASLQAHFESKGEKEFIVECRYTHKQGHTIWILCRGNVVEWNEDGSPKRVMGTHTDITNLKTD